MPAERANAITRKVIDATAKKLPFGIYKTVAAVSIEMFYAFFNVRGVPFEKWAWRAKFWWCILGAPFLPFLLLFSNFFYINCRSLVLNDGRDVVNNHSHIRNFRISLHCFFFNITRFLIISVICFLFLLQIYFGHAFLTESHLLTYIS